MDQVKPWILAISGPTAIGKSSLAIYLAKHLNGEILSADSRQFYRQMTIGTAKPLRSDLDAIPHHFINCRNVDDPYSAGQFETDALACVSELIRRNKLPILCGGSGLYVKAVVEGIDALPSNPIVRKELNDLFHEKGLEGLQSRLSTTNPQLLKSIDSMNPRRLIRAIEIGEAKPISESKNDSKKACRDFRCLHLILECRRDVLYRAINQRVDKMMDAGLLDEVVKLLPFRHESTLQTVGYTELFSYLDEEITLAEAISEIKKNSRRYAKRQITWLKKISDAYRFEAGDHENILQFVRQQLRKKSEDSGFNNIVDK